MQKDIMQELLNIDEKQKGYLSMLQRGQCIIRVNSIEKPFLLRTPYIERSWLTDEEIFENNKKIIEKYEKKVVITKIYCKLCGKGLNNNSDYCNHCSTILKDEDKECEKLLKYIEEKLKEPQEE